jgi:O-methyltransferase
LEGFFADTLPNAPIARLAIMRLDGDMYSSTWDALTSLYEKLSPGGFVIIDDYNALASCRQAVTDFRNVYGIDDELLPIDWSGAFWRRSG